MKIENKNLNLGYYCNNFNKIAENLIDKNSVKLKTHQYIDNIDYVSLDFMGLLLTNITRWIEEESKKGNFELRIEREYKNIPIDIVYVKEQLYKILRSKSYDPIIDHDEYEEVLKIYLHWDF